MMQSASDKLYLVDEGKMKKPISGKDEISVEIDMIQEAGILLRVKASGQGILPLKVRQPNPNLNLSSGDWDRVGPNTQMKQPWDTRSRIVRLTHAVTADDIERDEDYPYARDDMICVGLSQGNLVKVVMPRPNSDTPGVGKVFLEYADLDGASRLRSYMNGRPYEGNHVVAVYFPENEYAQGNLDFDG